MRHIHQFILVVFAVTLWGCQDPNNDKIENLPPQTPELLNDGWQTSSLEAQNINPDPITVMIREIRENSYTGISGVLLARNGKLILDEYFGEGNRDSLHTMRSASKALTSSLVGIAVDKGFIETLNTPVLSYFPEYEGTIENWDERKRQITIKHLLSMTSGVKGNEDAMYPTNDWIKFYLDQPLAAAPGEAFSYATSGVVTLGNIITRASGMRIPAFTDQYLFQPMGITEYRWPYTSSRGDQHLAMTGGGLNLKARDMLKFGQLYLNGGIWNGTQLISKDWIEESTSKHAVSDYKGEDFGYLWRMIDRTLNGRIIRSYEAWGNGGQFIMVFPSLDLVAVFIGENYGLFPEMEQPFELIDKYILSAIELEDNVPT